MQRKREYMNRITKHILECKCNWIRRETGLNIDVMYFNDTQKIVLRGVLEKGCSGCKELSWSGTKKELNNVLNTAYNIILEMKYADDKYRLDE